MDKRTLWPCGGANDVTNDFTSMDLLAIKCDKIYIILSTHKFRCQRAHEEYEVFCLFEVAGYIIRSLGCALIGCWINSNKNLMMSVAPPHHWSFYSAINSVDYLEFVILFLLDSNWLNKIFGEFGLHSDCWMF